MSHIGPFKRRVGENLQLDYRSGVMAFDEWLQDGATKIAKLVYKWLNNGLW